MSEQEKTTKTLQTVHKIESFLVQIREASLFMKFNEFSIHYGSAFKVEKQDLKKAKIWTKFAPKRSWVKTLIGLLKC